MHMHYWGDTTLPKYYLKILLKILLRKYNYTKISLQFNTMNMHYWGNTTLPKYYWKILLKMLLRKYNLIQYNYCIIEEIQFYETVA